MKAIKATQDSVTLELSKDELGFIGNSILETLNALDEREFQTRTGTRVEEAWRIQRAIRDLYRKIEKK